MTLCECGRKMLGYGKRCPACVRREQHAFGAALVAIALLIGVALLCGCATVRKTVATTATASRLAVEVTRDVCRTLATSWCTVNPCPELARCHLAERAFIAGASAFVDGAKHLNSLPTEIIDAKP